MDNDLNVLKSLLPIATPNNGGKVDVEDLVSTVAKTLPWYQAIARRFPSSNVSDRIKQLLGVRTQLADYQETSLQGLASFVDVRNKTVLEVGSDEDGNVLRALEDRGVRFALGIDVWRPKDYARVLSGKLVHGYGDILSLPYQDDSFDVLLNIATFEHIHHLDITMREMHRLLKPGGIMYAQFGPLWSSAVGHHLWCYLDDEIFRFNDPKLNPLDDFDHLVYDRHELAEKLARSWDDRTVNHLVNAVFDHSHINRTFHHEICDYMEQSPLEVLHMGKSWDIPVPHEIEQRLRDRHGDRSDFSCAGMQIVLRKGTHR